MAQYKQSEITNIYWASNEGFKGGRDPMGIQNSSIATYSKLLPGLTNLTKHIRYYSLYCWLLNEYDELEKNDKNSIHQYNFIRRAELAMAMIMKDQGIGSVVGSLYVSQNRYNIIEDGLYDIADGADFDSKDKYWSFKTGAFGQYYLGSLIYFELVKIEEGRFYLRNKGKELAKAFISSIDDEVRALFLDCIIDGSISEDEIKELQPFALHKIKIGSEEWIFLNNLLTREDSDSSFRKETIFLLLRDLEKGVLVKDFAMNQFLHANENKNIPASFGWYFYYLCECLHYSIDTLFCLILHEIKILHNPPLHTLTQNIENLIRFALGHEQNFKNIEKWREKINSDIISLYKELKNCVHNQDYTLGAVYALRLLLRVKTEYEDNKQVINEFESKNDLKRQRGILSDGLKSYVSRYNTYPISSYLESLIKQIMQEHTLVAIAKMGNHFSDLRKFIYEDGRIILVEQRYPVETSPRVDSLYIFLKDMGYISSSDKLTEIAKKYIMDYGKE